MQGELRRALKELTGEDADVVGSGRTDAGVHALCQTAHFNLSKEWEAKRLLGGINHFLGEDIRALSVERTDDDFHARFDCERKTYMYLMYKEPQRAAFEGRAWVVPKNTDAELMDLGAKRFLGEHDFSGFMSSGSDTKTTVRTVFLSAAEEKDGFIVFTVTANGFLYNMVRIMTAALVAVGQRKLEVGDIDKILKSGDRTLVKGIAPPHGLYLKSQQYPKKGEYGAFQKA